MTRAHLIGSRPSGLNPSTLADVGSPERQPGRFPSGHHQAARGPAPPQR